MTPPAFRNGPLFELPQKFLMICILYEAHAQADPVDWRDIAFDIMAFTPRSRGISSSFQSLMCLTNDAHDICDIFRCELR
jgi:hypothetical protein